MYDVKSVSLPDTVPILGYNYCLQIIETGFAEQLGLSRLGPSLIVSKSEREKLKGRSIEYFHFQTTSFLIGQYHYDTMQHVFIRVYRLEIQSVM